LNQQVTREVEVDMSASMNLMGNAHILHLYIWRNALQHHAFESNLIKIEKLKGKIKSGNNTVTRWPETAHPRRLSAARFVFQMHRSKK